MQKLSTPDEFKFPFEPYSIQLDFMRQLYETVEAGHVGIFESPTGTGFVTLIFRRFFKIFNYRKKSLDHLLGTTLAQ